MIKKIITTSIISAVIVAGASAQTIGDSMMKKDEGAMMKKDDSAMMMKKDEGAMMKKEEGAMMMKKEVAVTTTATSAEVAELQEVLIAKGYLVMPAGVAKGYFGKLTKAGLVKFQKANGLNSAGYFGKLTKAKISESKAMMKKDEGSMMMKKDESAMMMKKEVAN